MSGSVHDHSGLFDLSEPPTAPAARAGRGRTRETYARMVVADVTVRDAATQRAEALRVRDENVIAISEYLEAPDEPDPRDQVVDLAPGPDGADRVTGQVQLRRSQAAAARVRFTAEKRHATRPARAHRRPVDEHQTVRDAEAKVADNHTKLAAAKAGQGPLAKAMTRARRNTTDPQSRPMPAKTGGGWLQGYDGQFAVTADHLILAVDVIDQPTDCAQFTPMMTAATSAADRLGKQVGTVLADAGYYSTGNVTAPARTG